jgi:hypothetical protein
MIQSLIRGPASAKTLADEYGEAGENISYHLSKVLYERCGVVELVALNPRRGATEKVYALRSEAFVGTIDWPSIPRHLRWGLRGLALSNFMSAAIEAMEAEPGDSAASSRYLWRPLAVDARGQREIVEAMEVLVATVKTVEVRCAAANPQDLVPYIFGSAAFAAAPASAKENV